MNKPLVGLFVFPVVVLVAGFRLIGLLHSDPAEAEENGPAPTVYSGTAVRSQADFLKLHVLQSKVTNPASAALTDAEVAWLLHARRAVNPNKPYAASVARARPLEILLHADLSPAQKNTVFFTVLPDFESRDKWGAASDRIRACDAIEVLHDKRGIRYVMPLLRYPDPRVRARAKRALQSLGDGGTISRGTFTNDRNR